MARHVMFDHSGTEPEVVARFSPVEFLATAEVDEWRRRYISDMAWLAERVTDDHPSHARLAEWAATADQFTPGLSTLIDADGGFVGAEFDLMPLAVIARPHGLYQTVLRAIAKKMGVL